MVTNPMLLNNEKESTDKASHISTAIQNNPQLSIHPQFQDLLESTTAINFNTFYCA
jgi:hypothetical protein